MMTCKVVDTTNYPLSIPSKADFNQTLLIFKGQYDPELIHTKLRGNQNNMPYKKGGTY